MNPGWRSVARRPGKAIATGVAFALAILVMVVIQGFADGLYITYTGLLRNTRADLWVTEQGVRGVMNTSSVVPLSTVESLTKLPEVESVTPLFALPVIAEVNSRKFPLMLVGYEVTSGLGGPWQLAEGRRPRGDGEIVLDQAFAEANALRPGASFRLMGREFQVVGLSAGTNSFMSFTAFAAWSDVSSVLRTTDRTSFLLVRLREGARPDSIRAAVPAGVAVHTPMDLIRESEKTLNRVMGSSLKLLLGVAFLVGLAVIGLTTYTGVLQQRQEYAVLRALGLSTPGLALVIGTELAVGAFLGITAGVGLAAGAAALIGMMLPAYPVVLTTSGLTQTLLAGLIMAVLGALLPVWRISRMEPAAVFRV